MSDLDTTASEIHAQFSDKIDGLTEEDVHDRLDTLVNEYRVPLDEARRSVRPTYLDEAGLERDELGGGYSIKLNKTTGITELDEEIEVGDDSTTVGGALVDIQSGSGLIKRCPEEGCTRVLQNGRCSEHGEGEGEFDLRIKGVLDDGDEVHELIFDREATEALTGIGIEEAKEMAMDALDTTVVADEMRTKVLGSYYRVTGPTLGRYVLANETEELTGPVDAEATLIRARSI